VIPHAGQIADAAAAHQHNRVLLQIVAFARATLRNAEFGFLGVIVFTCRQTPRLCGQPCTAGCFGFDRWGVRGWRTN
jgi:hypothetical protein